MVSDNEFHPSPKALCLTSGGMLTDAHLKDQSRALDANYSQLKK